jgi:hypothetical protein
LLKEWERSISEGKLQAKKVRKSCEEAFNSIDGNLLGIDSKSNAETLSQMDMVKLSLDINEKEERDSAKVSQVTMADIVQIDKCMIKPSVQLCAIDTLDRHMEERLPSISQRLLHFLGQLSSGTFKVDISAGGKMCHLYRACKRVGFWYQIKT